MSRGIWILWSLAVVATAAPSGASITLGNAFLSYINEIVIQDVNLQLVNLRLADISANTNGVTGHATDVQIETFNIPLSKATLQVATGGLSVHIADLYGYVGMDWHYRQDSWPHVSGSGVGWVECNQTSVVFELIVSEAAGRPKVSCGKPTVTVGAGEYGGFPSQFHISKEQVAAEITKAIQTEVNTKVEAILAGLPVTHKLTPTMGVNYELVAAPTFAGAFMTMPLLGEVYDTKHDVTPPFKPSVTPPSTVNKRMVQLFITAYVFESIGFAYYKTGTLDGTVTNADVPAASPIHLNTSDWKPIVPALYTKYPAHLMTVEVACSGTPIVTISTAGITAEVATKQTYNVVEGNTTVPVFVVDVLASMQIDITLNKTLVMGKVTSASVPKVTMVSSTIGNFSTANLDQVLQFLLEGAVPSINKLIGGGHAFPALPTGWKLTGDDIVYGKDFVAVTADLAFEVPKKPWVLCKDGTGCDRYSTCCASTTKGKYKCCPLPGATCCSDDVHCCPHGYACVNGNSACAPGAYAMPWTSSVVPSHAKRAPFAAHAQSG